MCMVRLHDSDHSAAPEAQIRAVSRQESLSDVVWVQFRVSQACCKGAGQVQSHKIAFVKARGSLERSPWTPVLAYVLETSFEGVWRRFVAVLAPAVTKSRRETLGLRALGCRRDLLDLLEGLGEVI